MSLMENTDPKKNKKVETPKTAEELNRESLEMLAWAHYNSATTEKYNPYAYDSYTKKKLSDEYQAHREIILQEASINAAYEGLIKDREGNLISVDDLDKGWDGEPLWQRTTGYFDTSLDPGFLTRYSENKDFIIDGVVGSAGAIAPFMDNLAFSKYLKSPELADEQGTDKEAQKKRNKYNYLTDWIPGYRTLYEGIAYKRDGFVPVFDKKLGKYVLQQTGLSREDLKHLTDKVIDSGGAMEKDKSSFANFFKSFYRGVDQIPSGVFNTAVAVKDFSTAVLNATGSSAPGQLSFNPAMFKSSPDNWINKISKNLNEQKSIESSGYYMEDYEGAFDSAHSFSGAIGQGLSSLVEFGGVGSVARKGSTAGLKYILRKSAENTLKRAGKKYTKEQVDDLARVLASRYGNTFGTYAGGMVVNTGHILESAKENGLTDAEAATFALGVGAVATLIEAKLGTNELNNWLIGTKGKASRQIKEAILKETMGDTSGKAINRVVKDKNILGKIAEKLSGIAQKFNKNKKIFSEGEKLYTVGARTKQFGRMGLEEGTEEFLQSMAEKTGEFVFNNFFADLEDNPGDGMFAQRDFWDKRNFQEAFEEFIIGGMIGGSVGALKLDKPEASKSLGQFVAQGKTADIISVLNSLRDTGHYSEDQHRVYVGQINEMDRLWKEKQKSYQEAISKSSMSAGDKSARLTEAFVLEYDTIEYYNSLGELEGEYAKMQEEGASAEELHAKATDIKKIKATLYAIERRSKSLQDNKRAKYSKAVRDYEMDLNWRKEFTKQNIEELKSEVDQHKLDRAEFEKGSEEYQKLTDLINKKQGTIKTFRQGIKDLNKQIGNIKRKSFRNAFDEKVKEEFDELSLKAELVDNIRHKGLRVVTNEDNINELKKKGFKVVESPTGALYTSANKVVETPKSKPVKQEPKPEPKKKTETDKEPQTKDTKKDPFTPPEGIPDFDPPQFDGNLPDTDLDGKKPEQSTEPKQEDTPVTEESKTEPEVIFQIQRKGKGKYYDVISEKFIQDMHVVKIIEDGEIRDVVINDQWVLPKKGKTDKLKNELYPNTFETLFVHRTLKSTESQRIRALRQEDLESGLQFKFNNSFREAEKKKVEDGTAEVFVNQSRASMQRNGEFVDIEVWYKDIQLGVIENPYKYTYANRGGGAPVIFSNLTFGEFQRDFAILGGDTRENFERLKRDQEKLIELRKTLTEHFDQISNGAEEMLLEDFPYSFSQQYLGLAKDVAYELQDTEANTHQGDFIIFDKKRRTFLNDDLKTKMDRIGYVPSDLPKTDSPGSRYKTLVQIGPVTKWVDIVPKQALDNTDQYIENLNKTMEAVRALDTSIPLKSKKVSDLVDQLNSSFIALPLDNVYIKFGITKAKTGERAGSFTPVLQMYSTIDNSMDRMEYIDRSLKDFKDLQSEIKYLSGIQVNKENFKVHIAEDITPSDDNVELFSINNDRRIFQPVFKIDFQNMDLSPYQKKVDREALKLTDQKLDDKFEDIPATEEDLMEFEGSLEEFDKLAEKLILEDGIDELPDRDIQFQRLKGLTAYRSTYLQNWVAAQVSNYRNDKIGKEENVQHFIDKWVEGLSIKGLGITELTPETKQLIIDAKKEIKALDPDTVEGIYNRQLILDNVKKRFTASDKFAEKVSNMEEEIAEEADNKWDWDNTMLPPKLSKMVKDVIAFTLYDDIDPYGRAAETLINFPKVYEKLLHNLANTVDTDTQIARLEYMSKYDPQIAAVKARIDRLGPTDPVYKGFYNQFKMFRLNYLQTVIAKEKTNVFNAIQKDPAHILLTKWQRNHAKTLKRLSKKDLGEISQAMELFVGYMNSFDEVQLTILANEMPEKFKSEHIEDSFYKIFSALGIELPIEYIRGVMGDTEVKEAFDLDYMDGKTLGFIQKKIADLDTARYSLFHKEGELGRLKEISNNAYQFEDDLYAKTFVDAEKNTRYPFVAPNYLIQTSHALKQDGLALAKKRSSEHNYLVRLSEQTGEDIFKSLDFAYVGDIRDGSDGKTFKNLTERDFLMNRQALFNSLMKDGNDQAYYQPFVIAEKRSSYGFKLPVDKGLAKDGRVTAKGLDTVVDTIFRSEFERIKAVEKDKSLSKKYNNQQPFAQLTGLNSLPEFLQAVKDAKTFEDIRVQARKAILPLLEQAIENTISDLESTGAISNLDKAFMEEFGEDKDVALKNYAAIFELNDMLVRASLSEIIQGDAAILKNEIDRVKRASGLNAAGAPVTSGPIKVAYKTDHNLMVDGKLVNRKEGKQYESASDDAIVFVTPEYRKRIEEDMGRLTPEQAEVYDKIIRGEKLEPGEIELVDLNSAKTVYYTPEIYNKKSDFVLTREFTSRLKDGQWVAQKGREYYHNMLEWMLKNNVEQMVTLNATKGIKNDAIEDSFFEEDKFDLNGSVTMVDSKGGKKSLDQAKLDNQYFPSTELDGSFERLQVENKSKSAKGVYDITHPTQAIELIAAELSGTGSKQLIAEFDRLRDEIITENVGISANYLTRRDAEGKLNIEDFIAKAYQTLEASEEREEILKFLQSEDGDFKYNMNLPHLRLALMKMLVSHFNKGVLRDKMPGAKVTIVPSTGLKVVVDSNDNPVDYLDFEANPDKYDSDQYSTRELKVHQVDENGDTALAEIMITRRSANLMGLKLGDTIPENALELFGVRIPSQWYHSMISAKVVGFLPDTHGDIAALPKEMPLIAGEDFDVDARYLMIKQGYWVRDDQGNKTYKLYGDADTIEDQWTEYFKYNKDRKEIKVSVKQAKKFNKDYQRLKDLRAEFVQAIRSEKSVRGELYDRLVEEQKQLEEDSYNEFTEELDYFDPDFKKNYKTFKETYYKDEIKFISDMAEAIKKSKAGTLEDIENLKKLNNNLAMMETQMYEEAFKNYGLVPTFEDYKALDTSGQTPVNVGANKNKLIQTYIEMFTHHSIQDRLKVPASIDELKDEADFVNSLWGNVDEKGKTLESKRMLISSGGTFHAWRNNVTGASSIGNVAATNIVIAYATKKGLELVKPLGFDGKFFRKFSETQEEKVDDQGRVISEREFKWDTISALITAMTDNAKERLASKMNLIKVFVSPATIMSGLGIGKRRLALFFGQPVLRELDVDASTSLMDLQFIIEDRVERISGKIYASVNDDPEMQEYVLGNTRNYNINSADLISGASNNVEQVSDSILDKTLNKSVLDKSDIDFLITQFKVLKQLERVLKINSESFNIANILNTKKGFKDVDAAFKVGESYASIMNKSDKKAVFTNIKDVISSDPMIKAYLKATSVIIDSWKEHLLSLSPKYRDFVYDYKDILNTEGFDQFNTYITMQAFKSSLAEKGVDITSYDHLLYKMGDKKTLKELFTELYNSSDTFSENEFVKQTYTGNLNGMDFVGIDSFTSMVPELRDAVATGFEALWNSDTDPRERTFARMALMYLIQKDNMEFRRDSFISYIEPEMIKDGLAELDALHKEFKDTSHENIMGIKAQEFYKGYIRNLAMTSPYTFKDKSFSKNVAEFYTQKPVFDDESKEFTIRVSVEGELFLGVNGDEILEPYPFVRSGNNVYELLSYTRGKVDTEFVYRQLPQVNVGEFSVMHLSTAELMALADKLVNNEIDVEDSEGFARDRKPKSQREDLAIDSMVDASVEGFESASIPDFEFDQASLPDIDPVGLGSVELPNIDLDPTAGMTLPDIDLGGGLDPSSSPIKEDFKKDLVDMIGSTTMESLFKKFFPDSPYMGLVKEMDSRGIKTEIVSSDMPAYGMYYPSNLIEINAKAIASDPDYTKDDLQETLIHEVLHGVVKNLTPASEQKLNEQLTTYVEELKPYIKDVKDKTLLSELEQVVADPREMVTYAFSSKRMAEFLSNIDMDKPNQVRKTTFWSRLKEIIVGRIKKSIRGNKFDELVDIMDNVLDSNKQWLENNSSENGQAQAQAVRPQVKEGISEVFNENPELGKIGTEQQYSEYLDSVFPDSKVNDIVYHGSESSTIEEFDESKFLTGEGAMAFGQGFYFSENKSSANYHHDLIERASLSFDSFDQGDQLLVKEEFRQRKLGGNPSFKGKIYKVILDIKNPVNWEKATKEKRDKLKKGVYENNDSVIHTAKGYTATVGDKNNFEELAFELRENQDTLERGNFGAPDDLVTPEIKKQLLKRNSQIQEELNKFSEYIQGETHYVIPKSVQTHILGSKKDIKGFREFVGQTNEVELNKWKRKDIENLFDENPALKEIGSVEEYNKYLKSVFPNSKVDYFLYHGTDSDFDVFDKSTQNKNTDPNFISEGFWFARTKEQARDFGSNLKIVILNQENPYEKSGRLNEKGFYQYADQVDDVKAAKKAGNDSAILDINEGGLDGDAPVTEHVVFEPNQIHELGTKKDIEGFKEFVNKSAQQQKSYQAQSVRPQVNEEILFDESFSLVQDIMEIAKVDSFENLLKSGEIKFIDQKTKKPCLKHGANFGFTPGGTWKIIKEFKGKTHAQGGININTKDL